MIINGGSRSSGAFFARHLMRADHNERVTVTEMRGFNYSTNLREAFGELRDMAANTSCLNYFYHANINTRADEVLTPDQWIEAVERLETELHLSGQPRFVVEHDKEGRVHRHVVWGRIDTDTMTAIPDSHNYRTHELVATELETEFGHQATARALTRDKETTLRPEPRAQDWETFRAQQSKLSPDAMKAELTELWKQADTGQAFVAAIEERGYILARGDRRDFCVVDEAGHEHSLGRRLDGVKAAKVRERMADVERDALPSVADARDQARQRFEDTASEGGSTPPEATTDPMPTEAMPLEAAPSPAASSPFDTVLAEEIERLRFADHVKPSAPQPSNSEGADTEFNAVMAERLAEVRPSPAGKPESPEAAPSQASTTEGDDAPFEQVMHEAIQEERHQAEPTDGTGDGSRWGRFNAWLSNVRDHVASFGQHIREQWSGYFGSREPEASASDPGNSSPPGNIPDTTVRAAGAQVEPMQSQTTGPELG